MMRRRLNCEEVRGSRTMWVLVQLLPDYWCFETKQKHHKQLQINIGIGIGYQPNCYFKHLYCIGPELYNLCSPSPLHFKSALCAQLHWIQNPSKLKFICHIKCLQHSNYVIKEVCLLHESEIMITNLCTCLVQQIFISHH